jgi:hypothetical protein
MTLKKFFTLFVVSAAVLLLSALPLTAQTAGYDLLQTGSGAKVDLSSLNIGIGTVNLQGQQLDGTLGNTDTIMHRTQDTVGGGTTPVVVTALFMKSTSPVTYKGQSSDLYVTINNSAGVISTTAVPQPDGSSSSGSVTVYSGGTFDSNITINADLVFVKAGTSITSQSNWVGHQSAPSINLTSTASSWSSTPPSGYPSSPSFPSGGFYPKPVHTGPHPVVPASCNTGTVSATQPVNNTATKGTLATQPGGQIQQKVCAVAVQ